MDAYALGKLPWTSVPGLRVPWTSAMEDWAMAKCAMKDWAMGECAMGECECAMSSPAVLGKGCTGISASVSRWLLVSIP